MFVIDTIVNGRRYETKSRYNDKNKNGALTKIANKKSKLIKELTIVFN